MKANLFSIRAIATCCAIITSLLIMSCDQKDDLVNKNVALKSGSCPSSLSCPSGISCGCYTVGGLGTTKTGLKNVGGSRYWLASCMMETESMKTNYTYGDGKSGDSFNAGRAKQNFGAAKGAGVGQGSTGNFWNYCTNANNDKNVWNAIKSHYGSNYWAVHRGGPDWPRFKSANDWTDSHLNGHEYDDVRFWCSIPSI